MGTEPSSSICQAVHAALKIDDDDPDDDPSHELLMWKVPVLYRINAEHYEPLNWRFGLHQYCPEILRNNGTERFKIEVARALQLTEERWDTFCQGVVQEPKSYWEAMYGQSPHASSYTVEEIRCLLSLDALFLVVFLQFLGGGIKILSPALQKVMKNSVLEIYSEALGHNFLLLENQIPMELLKRVVGLLPTEYTDHVNMAAWEDVQWQGWNIGNCVGWQFFHDPLINKSQMDELFERRMQARLQHADSYHGIHILDSVYRVLCGWESLETPYEKQFQINASATYLEACGVKIQGKEFTCFEDISFENGYLSVPFFQVGDDIEKYFHNLVMHEMVARPGRKVRHSAKCYTLFMDGLMKMPKDVNLLVERGVLVTGFSSLENVVVMWKNINYNIPMPNVTVEFFTILTNVRNYARLKRNKFLFEFTKQFCSRP